jgi:hypothetical protein
MHSVATTSVSSPPAAPAPMKKLSSKNSSAKTTSANLESRFASGKNVLDYFDVARAVVTHGGARPGSGRKPTGKLQKTVKLSPTAVRRFQAYARREHLPDFSAALEAASRVV